MEEPGEVRLPEEQVRALVVLAMQSTLPGVDLADATCGYVQESVVVELMDAGPLEDLSAAAELLEPLLDGIATDLWETQDISDFCNKVVRDMAALREELSAAQGDGHTDGCCVMCERQMHLTAHHLTPRSEHELLLKRGASKRKLQASIAVCRPCHNAIHSLCDNKTLAEHFNTLTALMAHDKIHNFVNWASKQASKPKVLTSTGKMLQQKR